MAAIASQALAAKANVAGAKLNFKKNAARSVKAFSARAQAVSAPAVRHDAPSPFSRATRRARARFGTREREILPSRRAARRIHRQRRARRALGARGRDEAANPCPGPSAVTLGRRITRDPSYPFPAGRDQASRARRRRISRRGAREIPPAYWIGLVGATPSRVRSPRRVCASRRVSPKPAVRSIPSSPPARGILPLLTSLRPSPPLVRLLRAPS